MLKCIRARKGYRCACCERAIRRGARCYYGDFSVGSGYGHAKHYCEVCGEIALRGM